jgi:tetratricopeptide (TPR) repeat protein
VVVGTPLYLSPEQATGQAVDARSDLFTLGALLYECITGRAAFSGSSVLEIGAQVIHVNPARPSEVNARVPEELDRVVMKALAKKAVERYQSAEEMLVDLRRVHEELSDEDKHRTLRFELGSAVRPQPSALMTLNHKLGRPSLSIRFVLLVLLCAVLVAWLAYIFWRPSLHRPSAEAEQWYVKGTTLLRNGAFYSASKTLEQAVKADDNYALAHARLAEAEMELDHADQAKDELLRIGTLVPDRSIMPRVDALYLDAINAVVTRDFPRAIEAYQQIVKLTPDDSPNKAQVYVDLGRAYEKNDEVDKAIESYLKAAERDKQSATAYLRLGTVYARKQETASALVALDRAEALFQTDTNIEGKTEVLYRRGVLLRDAGRLPEAETQLQSALETARANNNDTQQIYIQLQLGRLYYTEGATARAQSYAQDAIDFAQTRGLENLVARGFNERAWAFFGGGDYEAAEKDFRQALEIARRTKLPYLQASTLYGLGTLLIQELRTDEGLNYVTQALTEFRERNYRQDISLCLTPFGRGKRRKGEYDAALEAFQEKLKLATEKGDQRQIAYSYDGLASIYMEQGRYPEAVENYQKCSAISRSIGDRLSLVYALMNQGNALWHLGRYDDALPLLAEANTVAKAPTGTYKQIAPEVQTIKAQMALSQRRFAEARSLAQQILDSDSKQYQELVVDAKYTMGLALALAGSGAEGVRQCDEAVNMALNLSDSARLSNAMLALAEAKLESGDAQGARTAARQVQARLNRAGQQELEWRAWLIASRASRRLKDDSMAQQELNSAVWVLSQVQQKWSPEAFSQYLSRPDIQSAHKQLGGE